MQTRKRILVVLLSMALPAFSLLSFDEADTQVRPVTKVVKLLQGMQEQLEKEAAEESEIMEKYNCWCKETGEDKEKAVLEAMANIKVYEARVLELISTSARLETEYKNLETTVQKAEASVDQSMTLRKEEVAKFQEEEKDLLNSLSSVNAAIDTVKVEPGKTSFLQKPKQKKVVHALKSLLARHGQHVSDDNADAVSAFLQDPDQGASSVQGVLNGLKDDFERKLRELQTAETENKETYEKLVATKRKEIDAAKIQIATKKQEKTDADEERVHKKRTIKETKENGDEDLRIARDVKERCVVKNREWEKRQKTRADETEAVSKAIEVLDADDAHALFSKTVSFLQVSSSDDTRARRQHASAMLENAGKKHDQRLVTLAMEAKLDGFAQVKEKIDIMIKDLKKEQADEVKKKDYCIEQLQQNKLDTEAKKREEESLKAKMGQSTISMEESAEAAKKLEADIAEVQKQQKIAAQNREKENMEFQKIVREQRETQRLLQKAMNVLAKFYMKKDESLIQKADASPAEPETFRSYEKKGASDGVMLMLQQLVADAKEAEVEATAGERESQADYEEFGKEAIAMLAAKNKEMTDKLDAKAKSEKKLIETRQSKEGVEADIDGLAETNFEIHESCDFLLQNFDYRQNARTEEIEALQQAKSYLNGAQR
eukprot:TRINITY_DN24958_c0_g1_i1.p1 TRINITY_DN24958_c0_g1~~TRINITY_DN24958_c0_g1_i1.p1  ORF type:complete len:690 (+),score=217.28 TRINITY_DN24958_c0_g1_i1:93-2072(+)